MNLSEIWLREYLSINLDLNEIINRITKIGLEVEKIIPVSMKFSGIKIGKVISCKQHPKCKKLKIFLIKINNKNIINVISDYDKSLINKKIAVAVNGSILPNRTIVEKKFLYGYESCGIFCTYDQLKIFGLKETSKDIIVLDKNAIIGEDIKNYFFLNDNIICIKVSHNRCDCLNIIGLSRAISSEYNELLENKLINKINSTKDYGFKIKINEPEACPKYLTRKIKYINLNVNTPIWISERIRRSGFKPKNIIIDIINYVFIETGQTIKIFDADKISGNITVRFSKEKESMMISKNKKIIIQKNTLVVSDKNSIIEIAGILLGYSARIDSKTTINIIISSVLYRSKFLFGNSVKYCINSDLAYRNERNMIDPNIQHLAINRATELILRFCCGSPGKIINYINNKFLPKKILIKLYKKKLYEILGFFISKKLIENILLLLGYKYEFIKNYWKVSVPSWRMCNVKIEEDLISDISRFYGFEKIPIDLSYKKIKYNNCKYNINTLNNAKKLLTNRGYQEIISYTFVDKNIQNIIHPNKIPVPIINPISTEMSVLRLSFFTNFIQTILYNQNRQTKYIKIFESGFCFSKNKKYKLGIKQSFFISGAVSGFKNVESWYSKQREIDFFDIKGDVETLLYLNGNSSDFEFKTCKNKEFHPGKNSKIFFKKKYVGIIGEINPNIQNKLDIKNRIFVFELLWDNIKNFYVPKIYNISDIPFNYRDISIVISNKIPIIEVIKICKDSIKKELININIFDIYQGKEIKKGHKSISIRLTLQNKNYNMTNLEINSILEKCICNLKKNFLIEIRTIC
ncbi:pheT [Wigglesworthia glossinidia endosymbiont of Glossina brevipalpis]|uniref:Phenylalanine--tRNA ligase beta subunit n=1 Tax=Wigglesworthia glossinidia brevipalpis TaxID=36870 RepID=SYFB_WIGBR|nr:RecName: Full=Phenylalanine--tRNA ligase beta subunit; AltName: Full=Phenylalanyl-tRNA synthetase beta subunit; Short=PheRS [Wigglesworthia glossinidia endosymbiont of Glossina brevipalpis]BAC24232.1 pheT [Wigglesworthia glossinidia endosymbiont of Glossina brevipalpis]